MTTTKHPPTNPEVAEAIGVHFTTVSKYRNGLRVPSRTVCARLATAYRLRLGDVIAAANEGPEEFGTFIRTRVFKED